MFEQLNHLTKKTCERWLVITTSRIFKEFIGRVVIVAFTIFFLFFFERWKMLNRLFSQRRIKKCSVLYQNLQQLITYLFLFFSRPRSFHRGFQHFEQIHAKRSANSSRCKGWRDYERIKSWGSNWDKWKTDTVSVSTWAILRNGKKGFELINGKIWWL